MTSQTPEVELNYCPSCRQMTNHGIGTNGGCLKCRITTPEVKEIEEWERKFDEMWTVLDFEVCTRDKSMNTQTLDDYESAQSDDIKDFIHHQLQKARHDWLREEIVRLEGMKKEIPKIIREPFEIAENVGKKMLLDELIKGYHSELDQAELEGRLVDTSHETL